MGRPNPFRHIKTSPEIIRLAVMVYIKLPLSEFAAVHSSIYNHFNHERSLSNRTAALAEGRQLGAA